MIKIENTEVFGWEAAIRGMRNPMNSWDKSDSYSAYDCDKCGELDRNGFCKPKEHDCTPYECFVVGENDLKLMRNLAKAGSDHAKYLRMINVTFDCTAPLYWWKEADTYGVGVVKNSCSTMHKIHAKEFTLDDFSTDRLDYVSIGLLSKLISHMNACRDMFIETKDKHWWWQMIQLLPSSYNQKRTVQLNYAVLHNMYQARKNHKLDEWREFCKWCEELPYFKEVLLNV
jgi:hypothetical protein